MQQQDYQEWLINWFSQRVKISSDAIHRDFFAEGWLDSFKTLELISDIEAVLNLTLMDSSLSDPRFSNIYGLSEILHEINLKNISPVLSE